MKEFLESLELKDLKKIAKKFKLDDKVARIALISNIEKYIEEKSIEKFTIEQILAKKVKGANVPDTDDSPLEMEEKSEDFKPTTEAIDKAIVDSLLESNNKIEEEIITETSVPAKTLSEAATRWYKYLNYMKGKRDWQEFISWFEVKYATTFKFWDVLKEVKEFLKIK